jgi:translation initiation factor 4G
VIEAKDNVYAITFLLQFKTKCQRKPKDMRPIDMPLRSNINLDFTPYEQEGRSENAETVRNLRILLNKLAKENFARISDTILNNFVYNPEILQEFARILFNKCVKEPSFIDVYMQLADQLFKKFNVPKGQPIPQGKEGMNFKKVFLTFCQTTFEHQENEDFLKEMPGDLDEEEKKQKKKQRIFGNMKLIGQLFIRGDLSDIVVKACVERLLKEDKEESIENACNLILTIGKKLYERYAFDAHQTTLKKKPKVRVKNITKEIFDDYIDQIVALKQTEKISSRVKFMIQDVIDARDQDWNNAFDYFVVQPKQGNPAAAIALRKKTKSIEKQEQNLPPVEAKKEEQIVSTDPKLEQRELRKKSVNEQNIFGRNIENYQKAMVDEKIRVINLF